MLAALLQATDQHGGAQLTDREASDEAVTMLLAGSDTTAAALSWSAYLLAKHANVRRIVCSHSMSVRPSIHAFRQVFVIGTKVAS